MTRRTSSRTPKEIAKKKSVSQIAAIQDRRNLVQAYLFQHYTPLQIAHKVGVKLATVESDIKIIDGQLGSAYRTELAGKRERELSELDQMERETMEQMEEWKGRAAELWAKGDDDHGYPKALEPAMRNAGGWWSKRLDIKKHRADVMGWKREPVDPSTINNDNRSITLVVQDPSGNGKPKSFDDYVKGMFNDPSSELVEGEAIEGEVKELPDGS